MGAHDALVQRRDQVEPHWGVVWHHGRPVHRRRFGFESRSGVEEGDPFVPIYEPSLPHDRQRRQRRRRFEAEVPGAILSRTDLHRFDLGFGDCDRSAPCSKARTIGAQPSACTAYMRGRAEPMSPRVSSSSNAFHIPISPVPPPVGYTTTSGRLQPKSSASSKPSVFLPSTRYGSRSVAMSKAPVFSPSSRANLPQSEMRPSSRIRRAPQISASSWLAAGASAGITTVARMPAAAAYAARAPAALPADGATRWAAPSSAARLTATAMPLALKDPVGFTLSALMCSPDSPSLRARRAGGSSGVEPSPRDVMKDRRRTGSSSSHRHSPP